MKHLRFRRYRREWLRGDLLAGVTAAAVVIPQAMAYATIAGLPIELGLYTALVPLLVYAFLGTSRSLSVSTTSTIAALTAVAVASASPQTAEETLRVAATLGALTGVILLSAGLLRLGFLADFISSPVLAGFKAGTGLLIIAGQLGKVLGVDQSGDNFFQKTWSALEHLGDASGATVLVAAVTLGLLAATHRWAPRSFPGALVAVALGILLTRTLDLGQEGVALVGAVPSGLPSLELPDLGLVDTLLPAAAGIALMAYVESIAAARAFGRPNEPEVDADRELVAIGAANVASGAVAGLPAGGGLSQTAVNDAAGARTPFAGSVTAAVTLLVLLFLTGLFDSLPQATLGAVVIVAAAGLVDIEGLRALGRIRGSALVFGLVTLVGVLLFGVLDGVLIGVLASMLGLVYALNRTDVVALARAPGTTSWHERGSAPGEAPPTGILVVRIGGPVYFANAGRLQRRLLELVDAETEPAQTLVIDLVAVGDTDVTTMQRLPALERALRDRGVTLHLARPNERLAEHCERMPELADLRARVHGNVDDAVRRSPTDIGVAGPKGSS